MHGPSVPPGILPVLGPHRRSASSVEVPSPRPEDPNDGARRRILYLMGFVRISPRPLPNIEPEEMKTLETLFNQNREWAERVCESDPEFFPRLARQQRPKYLWIGCSDSRVPANQIVGLQPGELFVHRNVANVVVHTDLNCLSVLQFAVDVLGVSHVIVCGHYGCGGVSAAMNGERHGLIDNWLRHVENVMLRHTDQLESIEDPTARLDRLCELNVVEQVVNVCRTTIVEDAWSRGQDLSVHGWVYGLSNGLLRDLDICVRNRGELAECYSKAAANPA